MLQAAPRPCRNALASKHIKAKNLDSHDLFHLIESPRGHPYLGWGFGNGTATPESELLPLLRDLVS